VFLDVYWQSVPFAGVRGSIAAAAERMLTSRMFTHLITRSGSGPRQLHRILSARGVVYMPYPTVHSLFTEARLHYALSFCSVPQKKR